MSTRKLRLGSIMLMSGIAVAAVASVAGATTTPGSLSTIQSQAAAAITLRVNDLNQGVAQVNGDTHLGSGAPALAAYLQHDIPGLQALGQKIAGDSTAQSAGADAKTIFTDYRVLALVLPAAKLAGASDQIVNGTVPRLTADATKAGTYVNASNQAVIGPLLSDANAQIGAASTAVSGIPGTVLAYTPAQWNANHALLSSVRASVTGAAADIKKAEGDLQQVLSDLKSEHASGTSPSTNS